MTPSLIIGTALAASVVVLVLCIAIGIFGYKPERAKAIRRGEAKVADTPVMVEEIKRIHVAPIDRFRRGRIDRHPLYIAIHLAAIGYSSSILSGAKPTSNLTGLEPTTLFTMAVCFLIGGVLVLAGAVMGCHLWRWNIVPGVSDHIAASRLGDDIRLPYMFGLIGMCTISVSLGIYATTSFSATSGSWGGWSAMCVAGGCVWMVGMYLKRIRQYSLTVKAVVKTAVANVISRGQDVE